MAKADSAHRGRLQAQGGKGRGLQESEGWAQEQPLTATDGHGLLTTLHDKLSLPDQQLRRGAFNQAHTYIDSVSLAGGTGPTKRTFPKGKLRRTDARVDIEVIKGIAFVPDAPNEG